MFRFLKALRKVPDNPDPNYHAYTTEFDKEISAEELDHFLGTKGELSWEKSVSIFDEMLKEWLGDARLSAINKISEHHNRLAGEPLRPTCAALLIDHSGSMEGQRAMLACAATELIAETWSRMGIPVEILGFTTTAWRGGKSRKKWKWNGKPKNPGRLNDLLHIVYQDTSHRRAGAPYSIRNMFRKEILKENIDGEAVEWCAGRLRKIKAKHRAIVVISDGAPVDDSTLTNNPSDYLENHLLKAIGEIVDDPEFSIHGIGVDYDLDRYYPNWMKLTSTGQFKSDLLDFVIDAVENGNGGFDKVEKG